MDVVVWDAVPVQVSLVLIAFGLTSLVGLERRLRRKSAGLRTHALVGTGSAVFTLVSAYGFGVLPGIDAGPDPSRVAAQIITGIGFLGAGVIFTDLAMMAGVASTCEVCGGKRFKDEVQEYTLRDRTISDVLGMTAEEALAASQEIALQTVTEGGYIQ